jgi:hypothetical protein
VRNGDSSHHGLYSSEGCGQKVMFN